MRPRPAARGPSPSSLPRDPAGKVSGPRGRSDARGTPSSGEAGGGARTLPPDAAGHSCRPHSSDRAAPGNRPEPQRNPSRGQAERSEGAGPAEGRRRRAPGGCPRGPAGRAPTRPARARRRRLGRQGASPGPGGRAGRFSLPAPPPARTSAPRTRPRAPRWPRGGPAAGSARRPGHPGPRGSAGHLHPGAPYSPSLVTAPAPPRSPSASRSPPGAAPWVLGAAIAPPRREREGRGAGRAGANDSATGGARPSHVTFSPRPRPAVTLWANGKWRAERNPAPNSSCHAPRRNGAAPNYKSQGAPGPGAGRAGAGAGGRGCARECPGVFA